MTDMDREATHWHWDTGAERFPCMTQEEAIEDFLASREDDDAIPQTIVLHGYARMRPSRADCGLPLEDVLDRLDEEYGDPDGEQEPEVTAAMRVAEAAFLDGVLHEYVPFACEQVAEVTVTIPLTPEPA